MKNKRLLLLLIFFTAMSSLYSQALISLRASQEQYFDSSQEELDSILAPSSNGIYPVKLTVTTRSPDKTLYIKIYRSQNQAGPFSLIIDTMQGNEEYFDLYDTQAAEPGVKYYYIAVLGRQTLDQASPEEKSNVCCGWGALTHEAFYVFFNTTIKKSYPKMTLMNNPSALKKLGSEETKGDKSGKFLYNAKVKGMGGLATMTYQNYSDDNIVFFTGDMITQADMFSSGKMDGQVKMSGMYNGTIYFENVTIKESKASAGTYGIKPTGAPRKEIDYSWNFAEKVQ